MVTELKVLFIKKHYKRIPDSLQSFLFSNGLFVSLFTVISGERTAKWSFSIFDLKRGGGGVEIDPCYNIGANSWPGISVHSQIFKFQ